ncbi:MAG: hypothetical protein ACRCY8_17395 [Dermatophilaceae bacterium]
MPDQPPRSARPHGVPPPRRRMRRLPAVVCGLHAAVLGGLGLVGLGEVVVGASVARARVAPPSVLALLAAVALAVMARGWLVGSGWQRAPTIVWGLVLVPVGIGLSQGGDRTVGGSVVLAAVVTVAAAVAAGPPADADGPAEAHGSGEGAPRRPAG